MLLDIPLPIIITIALLAWYLVYQLATFSTYKPTKSFNQLLLLYTLSVYCIFGYGIYTQESVGIIRIVSYIILGGTILFYTVLHSHVTYKHKRLIKSTYGGFDKTLSAIVKPLTAHLHIHLTLGYLLAVLTYI